MYVWKCLNDPPVRRCILAVALQPTKYLPLAAAAAALASHTFGAMRRATVLHRQLQKSLKKTLLDALTKRCEEPLAKLLATTGVLKTVAASGGAFLHNALDKLLEDASEKAGIQPSLCRMIVAILIDDRNMLQEQGRQFCSLTNSSTNIDSLVHDLIARVRHQQGVRLLIVINAPCPTLVPPPRLLMWNRLVYLRDATCAVCSSRLHTDSERHGGVK